MKDNTRTGATGNPEAIVRRDGAAHRSCSAVTAAFTSAFAAALLCVSVLDGTLAPAVALADSPVPQKAQEFTSYLRYELKPEHFQASYSDIIRTINAGSGTPPKPAVLQQALKMLAAREQTETRGRIDIVYFLEGYTYEKLGKKREALAAYERAVHEKSQAPLYLFRHALLLKEQGKCARAVVEFEQLAWAVKQASAEPLYLAGECFDALEKPDDAKRMYAESAKRNPRFAPALRKSLIDLKKQYEEEYDPKKKPELEAQLKSVLESIVNGDPSDRESTLTLAEMYLNNSKNVISTASLTRAGELATVFVSSSKYKDDRAVHILYESQRRLQKTSDAKQTLKRGLAATPASELLTADARQETIEQQLQGTAPESR